jgi:Ni/Co efflux regulator RcnB
MNELIVPVLLAALMSGSPGAHAQQRGAAAQQTALLQEDGREAKARGRYRSVETSGELKRGERLPPRYRTHHYVIENWRAHKLSAPPRGHQWVQAGSDYALVAIATGLVVEVLVSAERR